MRSLFDLAPANLDNAGVPPNTGSRRPRPSSITVARLASRDRQRALSLLSSRTPEESQVESCEHQYNANVHYQPFPESVSEEREIHADYDGCHCHHVQRDSDLPAHFSLHGQYRKGRGECPESKSPDAREWSRMPRGLATERGWETRMTATGRPIRAGEGRSAFGRELPSSLSVKPRHLS